MFYTAQLQNLKCRNPLHNLPGQGGPRPQSRASTTLFFHDTHGGDEDRLPNQPGFILFNSASLFDLEATTTNGIKIK